MRDRQAAAAQAELEVARHVLRGLWERLQILST
jgi:hypothetical protein